MWFALALSIASFIILNVVGLSGVKALLANRPNSSFRKIALRSFWLVDVIFVAFAIVYVFFVRMADNPEYVQYRQFFVVFGGFTLILIVKAGFLLFVMLHFLKNLLSTSLLKIVAHNSAIGLFIQKAKKTKLLLMAGAVFSVFLFCSVVHGMIFGKHNFKVVKAEVIIEDLPASFDGFRIVHFSDTHLGSFKSIEPVAKGLQKIADIQPDLIVFSGDMVNNDSEEAEKFIPVFQKLQPPLGMFSVLGNHDMGDYRRWGTIPEKETNLERLIEVQQEMGFDVLLNQHRFLKVGNDSIMMVGIKNWGQPPFSKYGDLSKAMGQNADFPFKLLISHDPSHWRAEVLPLTDILLTFSGHTHGFQFGIITPFFRWSPVQLKYPEWHGLYQEGSQFLYVNRGFGYLSFPARVGITPEITLITLKSGSPS